MNQETMLGMLGEMPPGSERFRTPVRSVVFKVMGDLCGNQDEGTALDVDPFLIDQDAHCACEDVEEGALGMAMGTRSSRHWFWPPLGNRASSQGLVSIGFEEGGEASHDVVPVLVRVQIDGFSGCGASEISW